MSTATADGLTPSTEPSRSLSRIAPADALASATLALMVLVPLIEMAARPLWGRGIENAPIVVQHLGLLLAMAGAIAAERTGHLTTLGSIAGLRHHPRLQQALNALAQGIAALVCGLLAWASWQFVSSEAQAPRPLAYGMPTWWVQASLPLGFAWLGLRLGARGADRAPWTWLAALTWPLTGIALAHAMDGQVLPVWPGVLALAIALLAGAPIFAVLGGLALVLFSSEALPLASVPLSHYQITVNPSLPALPLFTLAGLVLAHTQAAQRLGNLFLAIFGQGLRGTVLASSVLCSAFTATTGGSGVTILALGGLLLPLLKGSGCEERRAIGLVTSASALGVLLAPAVPLIMFAVIARVPIGDMFLAGLIPAVLMVVCLLLVGGYLRRPELAHVDSTPRAALNLTVGQAAWQAKWELLAPVVAIGSLASGWATPTEGAALTAAYALLTQAWAHRELDWRGLWLSLTKCGQLIGGVMLILGMALALTNFLIDAGIPDQVVEHVQRVVPNKYVFLLALCAFLFVAAALMEIFAALVVLVPLLLPLTASYDIDPVHFGIIFLAAMEAGFLCPPAGMNLYFASAMFGKPIRYIAVAVLPALLAIFTGTALIALIPALSTALPRWFGP